MEPIEIHYAGRLAAFSWGEDVLLAPHIGVLEEEHPDRLFVGLMCVWAADVVEGKAHGPYNDQTAHVFARCSLMPSRDFVPRERWADHELAEYFGAPLAQVEQRRVELLREAEVKLAPRAGPGAL